MKTIQRGAVARGALTAALVLLLVACNPAPEEPSPSPSPSRTPVAAADWTDTSRPVTLEGGWTVVACEGDAPLLCVERGGETVGVVEAAAYPLDSIDGVDPEGDPEANLNVLAQNFYDVIGRDRAEGCGEDYDFQPHPVRSISLDGNPAVAYGYTGTLASGEPSELNLQYATVRGDDFVVISAIAYDEGGCPGRDDLSSFDSATLADFQDPFEELLEVTPLPDLT